MRTCARILEKLRAAHQLAHFTQAPGWTMDAELRARADGWAIVNDPLSTSNVTIVTTWHLCAVLTCRC